MIDPLREDLITPNEATRYYPRSSKGKKVHVSKVYRDMQSGLEFVRTPRIATSKEAIARFFRQLSAMSEQDVSVIPIQIRSRNDERIERELDRLGI